MRFWRRNRSEAAKEQTKAHINELIRDPPAPSFSISHMDLAADPRKDFYSYSSGGWLRSNPIPEDKSRWSAFNELDEWNQRLLGRIVNDCVANKKAAKGSPEQLVGDLYSSAMDVEKREKLGFSPIKDLLKGVSAITSKKNLLGSLPKLHKLGVGAFFDEYVGADPKSSDTYAFHLYQGGLSLPDREYYLSDKFSTLRKQFQDHVARMFDLSGINSIDAQEYAKVVLSIEKELALSSRTRTELRDAENNYNKLRTSDLDSRYESLRLQTYLSNLGVKGAEHIIVGPSRESGRDSPPW